MNFFPSSIYKIIKDGNAADEANVTNSNLHTSIQDPLTSRGFVSTQVEHHNDPPFSSYFLQDQANNFTLSADAIASTVTTLNYIINLTGGHGFVGGEEILLLDTAVDKYLFAVITNVAVNVITLDRPVDYAFASATTIGRTVSSEMAVDGSVTPQIFTIRAGAVPWHLTRVIMTMVVSGTTPASVIEPRDDLFGNLPAGSVTNGLCFRATNSLYQRSIWNFKTNGEMRNYCFDLNYIIGQPTLGPGGATVHTVGARWTFNGPEKHGVIVPIDDNVNSAAQWVVQDDLTIIAASYDILSLKMVGQGHEEQGL